jgi:hypothetical protein
MYIHPQVPESTHCSSERRNDPAPSRILLLEGCPLSPNKKPGYLAVRLFWNKGKKALKPNTKRPACN